MVYPRKREALEGLDEIERQVEQRKLHRTVDNGSSCGVIVSGMVALSLLDVLQGVPTPPDVLKLAMPYPCHAGSLKIFLLPIRK